MNPQIDLNKINAKIQSMMKAAQELNQIGEDFPTLARNTVRILASLKMLEINVSEQNLRTAGIAVKSGLCKVKGRNMFIMDKHKSIRKKIKILASHLAEIPHENVFIVPAIRELLEKEQQLSH